MKKLATDFFYAIAIDIEKSEAERIRKSEKELEDLLKNCDYSYDSGYFFIPFWYDEESGSALDDPLREIEPLQQKLEIMEKILKKCGIKGPPIILSGYDMILSGKEENFFGHAYLFPEEYDFSIAALREKGINVQELEHHEIKRDVKEELVSMKLIGAVEGSYLYRGNFTDLYSYNKRGPFLLKTFVINGGITATEFINIYHESLEEFKALLDTLTPKWKENEIGMVFWSEMVTDSSMDWPNLLDKKGRIEYHLNDKDVIKKLEAILGKKLGRYDLTLEKGRVTDLHLTDHPELTMFPSILFSLEKLSTLVIRNTQITEIPRDIKKLENLRTLHLKSNNIRKFPEVICHLSGLLHLGFSNHVEEIPESIGNLPQLKTLGLEENKITNLPITIGNLKNLMSINLSGNPIELLPIPIYGLDDLGSLYLEETNLKELSPNIKKLKKLDTLLISHKTTGNFHLPAEITELPKLRKIEFKNLGLKNIPNSLLKIQSIKYLDLSYNELSSLPDTFNRLTELYYLDISSNSIAELPASLSRCNNLKTLIIKNNPLVRNLPTYPPSYENIVHSFRLKELMPIKLLGVERYNIDSVAARFAEIVIDTSKKRDGSHDSLTLYDLNKRGWDIQKRAPHGFMVWKISYYIGSKMIELAKQYEEKVKDKVNLYIGYGKDLAASSLMLSDNIEDIKQAIELFEQAKNLSPAYYTTQNYEFTQNKLEQMLKEKNYFLITNKPLTPEEELIVGLYYTLPYDLSIDVDDVIEKLELLKDDEVSKFPRTFKEDTLTYDFLGKLNDMYFYLVRFSPEKVSLNRQTSPGLMREILNSGLSPSELFQMHAELLAGIKKIHHSVPYDQKKRSIEEMDVMVMKKGISKGGVKWPSKPSLNTTPSEDTSIGEDEIINYRGTPLLFKDYEFIRDMERYFWGESIPYKVEFEENKLDFGFIAENGRIIKLYLAHGDLFSPFPESIGNLDALQVLDISWNELPELPTNIKKLKRLIHLNFYFNKGLEKIPDALFELSNLEKLDMHYNKDLTPDLERIDQLQNLKYLDLSQIPLKKLPDSLKKLKHLEHLNINGCDLTEIPEVIGELTSLKILEVGTNPLENLPLSLRNLTSLEALLIDKTEIKSIPEVVFSLTSLKRLKIHNNIIPEIPDLLKKLKDLEYLEISQCKITKIPDAIGELTKLINLNISDNAITEIPAPLTNLKNLESLDLEGNKISKFPESILGLQNLKTLNLGSNLIKTIPAEIEQMNNLEALILFHNKFTELPKTLGNLKNLKILNLQENKLTAIPDELPNLENLEELDVRFIKFSNPLEIQKKMNFVPLLRMDNF